jgi:hypothetical protein
MDIRLIKFAIPMLISMHIPGHNLYIRPTLVGTHYALLKCINPNLTFGFPPW